MASHIFNGSQISKSRLFGIDPIVSYIRNDYRLDVAIEEGLSGEGPAEKDSEAREEADEVVSD